MDESGEVQFRPPYLSFATFWNFIQELASHQNLPPQIDSSVLSSKSGTDRKNILAALTSFELIDAKQGVLPGLTALTAGGEEERKAALAALVRRSYPEAMWYSERNGTEQQLHEAFRDSFGLDAVETRRKAVTFFLHAARTASIPLSEHFPTTRSGSGAPGTPRTKRSPRRKQPAPGAAANGGSAGGQVPSEGSPGYSSQDMMRSKYFELLLKKAEEAEEANTDLLDRIERLVGMVPDQSQSASKGEAVDGQSEMEDRAS